MADGPKTGLGIDSSGGPVVDPTKNVLDLVKAAMERQDDLRSADKELFFKAINDLKELMGAKFESVDGKFETAEKARIEQKLDNKVATDAAFSAAKDAVREQATASEKAISKSENNAADQFKQQRETTSAQLGAVESSVTDLKERVGKLETQQQTKSETRTDTRLNIGTVVGTLGFVFAVLMGIIVLMGKGAG